VNKFEIYTRHLLWWSSQWEWYGRVMYESVSKSFRTARLERELQMLQLSATRCSCIAICESV